MTHEEPELSLEDLRRMEYCGAGYFRLPGPVGKKRPILHGPQIVERLLTIIDAQNNSA